MAAAIVSFLAGFWAGAAFCWYRIDAPSLPLSLRIERAVTWLPLLIYYPIRDRFRDGGRR